MKSWRLHEVGDIRLEDVSMPEIQDHEVLVEVKAAGICGSDIPRIYKNGAHKMPLIPGHEFSGRVVEVGKCADHTWKGKKVGVFPLIPCRDCKPCQEGSYEMCHHYDYLGSRRDGGFAEYVAVPEWNLVEIPENVSFEEAAMLEPMAVAVHAMRRIQINPEDTVVVLGLGTIGQLLTMFLLERGISNLIVVGNKEFQKRTAFRLGVKESHYLDSTKASVRELVMQHSDGYGGNAIFECVGKNETIAEAVELAAPAGEVCLVGNPGSDICLPQDIYWNLLRHQLRVTGTWNSSYQRNSGDDWSYVLRLLEQGRIRPAQLITHRFGMEDLEQGFHTMRDKTEDYIKIMMTRCGE
ncbi:MAG: galactitol-1-phosphate 5-dehydrogenase [Lachnospiraceae bacterium]|nr:galactitol-1-phosphate 5-dehydrogenase [Lachnospiraceae bacterium]